MASFFPNQKLTFSTKFLVLNFDILLNFGLVSKAKLNNLITASGDTNKIKEFIALSYHAVFPDTVYDLFTGKAVVFIVFKVLILKKFRYFKLIIPFLGNSPKETIRKPD